MPTEEKSSTLERMAKLVASVTALVLAVSGLTAAVRQFVPALQLSGGATIAPAHAASPSPATAGADPQPAASGPAAPARPRQDALPMPATGADDYILPASSTVRMSPNALGLLSAAQLRVARNEIYARHGWRFSAPELQAYFNARSWYRPVADNRLVTLSAVEKANIQGISEAEKTAR